MILKAIERGVIFKTTLMDTWYAITRIMQQINELGYKFVYPIRSNRQILDCFTDPKKLIYKAVKELPGDELEQGTKVKLKQCSLKVNLFQLSVHPNRTDYVITNDKAICTSEDATKACGFRWKIEQYHREVKQTTGIAKCKLEILKLSASIL